MRKECKRGKRGKRGRGRVVEGWRQERKRVVRDKREETRDKEEEESVEGGIVKESRQTDERTE